ncbi:hypothetical protein HY008_01980 [Candidatus Woesebacteria bacterium]|nr:hypothetical protein [Candidatus Woesebacteria bacterium]
MVSTNRRIRSYERQTKIRIAKLIFLTLGLVVLIIFLGPRVIVQFSIFSERFKPSSEQTENKTKSLILPPQLDPLPEATKENAITVSGNAQQGTTIEVFVNDVAKGKIQVNSNHAFSLDKVKLKPGENRITAVASLPNEGQSEASQPVIIVYKNEPPPLTVTEPEDKAKRSGDEKTLTLKGSTAAGNEVTVNGRIVVVDREGNFEYTLILSDGTNNITILAHDNAGNETKVERSVSYNP